MFIVYYLKEKNKTCTNNSAVLLIKYSGESYLHKNFAKYTRLWEDYLPELNKMECQFV